MWRGREETKELNNNFYENKCPEKGRERYLLVLFGKRAPHLSAQGDLQLEHDLLSSHLKAVTVRQREQRGLKL